MGINQDWEWVGPLADDAVQNAGSDVDDATPDTLEAGIAAVFDAIRNSGGSDEATDDDLDVEDNGATFALLSELNRLWERPQA